MYSEAVQKTIEAFKKLPGVGPKTAERYVFYLLRAGNERVKELIEALLKLNASIVRCEICRAFASKNPCGICQDQNRDSTILCIVAKDQDIPPIEKSGAFNGRYYVLGGVLNPLDDDARGVKEACDELIKRLKKIQIKEILLALSPDMDGETTLLYLQKRLADTGVQLSRLARGIPVGAEVEYADEITLKDAIESRKKL